MVSVRSSETTVTFRHPFTLTALDGLQAAGTYRLVTDEEEVPGLSFLAYRRVATMLHLPAITAPAGPNEVATVDADELARALEADQRT